MFYPLSFEIGAFNPFEKCARKIGNHFPKVRGETSKTYLKPQSSFFVQATPPPQKKKKDCHDGTSVVQTAFTAFFDVESLLKRVLSLVQVFFRRFS